MRFALFSDRTHRVAVVTIVVVHVMTTAIEVEVVRVVIAVRRRTPIVTVATSIIER